MMKTVNLAPALKQQMYKHAAAGSRLEVCGLLGGTDMVPETYYPITNIAEDQTQRYLMDPEEQIQTFRLMREANQTLCGIFHSHPSSPALPSTIDKELAAYPDVIYYIASLLNNELDLQAYYYNGGDFEQVALY